MKQPQQTGDAGGVVGARVVALCGLCAVPGVGASTLKAIIAEFGTVENAVRAGAREIHDRVTLRQDDTRAYLLRGPDLRELGRWALEAARKAGARVVTIDDPDYPPRLRAIPSPPPVLYVKGFLERERQRVAIVGSREPDEVGAELARSFGDGLGRHGVQVVSGGARGVDTYAHEGAVWASGSTVAVLGSGIDVVYPPENADLFDRIGRVGGAVVSEFAPGTPPHKRNFPRRNRTVAGLSDVTVVVRAAAQSGALITAKFAKQYHRTIYAVPGDPTNPLSAGCNELLKKGEAIPATSYRDLLTAIGILQSGSTDEVEPVPREQAVFPPSAEQATETPPDRAVVDEVALKVWRLLDERTPAHVDDLALRAQIPASEALRKLAELEFAGMCLQRPGKYFLRAKG